MSDFQIPILSQFVGLLAEWMRIALELCYQMTVELGFPSYGIAIIVLTIIIKVALLPLAVKQIRSMKGMQEIQPKIQELQKKYKNDRAKMSAEMQKLYKENNVSPLAGCLPLLIQMPFLVSIYYALQGFPYDPAHESFLWMESLAVPDPTYILPVLSALSTWVITWQTTPKKVEGPQKGMMYFMPLFIGYISLQFPSGLVVYWVVVNLFQLVQQTIMFRDEYRKGPSTKGVVTVTAPARKKGAKKPAVKKAAEEAPARKAAPKKTRKPAPKKEPEEDIDAGDPEAVEKWLGEKESTGTEGGSKNTGKEAEK